MTSFQSTMSADARFGMQPVSVDSTVLAGSCLVVFCLFLLIMSVVHRRIQRDAEQLKADRELLERIWQMNSNLEH